MTSNSAVFFCLFFYLGGVAVGMLLANWSWRRTIRSNAASGFRLEVGGALYQVMTAEDYDSDAAIRNTVLGQ